MTENYEIEDEEELSFDEQMREVYGSREDWLSDQGADGYGFTSVYVAFLKNDCKGLLSYEQALEKCKTYSGQVPESVTECPEIDWVEKQRQEHRKDWNEMMEKFFGMDVDEFIETHYPFEPMLKFQY